MHHNVLGFSGTQGNSVLITESDIYDNALGISFDSENDHPNFPERSSVIENNDIHDNNFDVYGADSDVPVRGPGYDFFRYPIGTGMWIVETTPCATPRAATQRPLRRAHSATHRAAA